MNATIKLVVVVVDHIASSTNSPGASSSGIARDDHGKPIKKVEVVDAGPRAGVDAEAIAKKRDEYDRATKYVEHKTKARSKRHLMTHTPVCESCEGCMAKAIQKSTIQRKLPTRGG